MIDATLSPTHSRPGRSPPVNPCGFAMLPAYLSYFLGIEAAKGIRGRPTGERRHARWWSAPRCPLGFLVVFGIVGTLVNAGRLVSSSTT